MLAGHVLAAFVPSTVARTAAPPREGRPPCLASRAHVALASIEELARSFRIERV